MDPRGSDQLGAAEVSRIKSASAARRSSDRNAQAHVGALPWGAGDVLGDWTVAGLLRYASGALIPVPGAQNKLASLVFQNTRANRVEGQPLFLKDPNCGCIDPRQDFVLNPAAWADPAPGASAFEIRAEFFNMFNRTYLVTPSSNNAVATRTFNTLGQPTGGFGYVNPSATPPQLPRSGQIVARFEF